MLDSGVLIFMQIVAKVALAAPPQVSSLPVTYSVKEPAQAGDTGKSPNSESAYAIQLIVCKRNYEKFTGNGPCESIQGDAGTTAAGAEIYPQHIDFLWCAAEFIGLRGWLAGVTSRGRKF
ncbi:hypothetical protein GCM10007169_03420 [Shewanella fodinae]|nr:hypothetical protein GCM10007169_03420 [Shewanella fodinae]